MDHEVTSVANALKIAATALQKVKFGRYKNCWESLSDHGMYQENVQLQVIVTAIYTAVA